MAVSLKELLAQRAALEQQIIDAQRAEKAEAISKVRSLMAEYGLSLADLQLSPRGAKKSSGAKVPAKYRDRATGSTWSGRGLQPRWLKEAMNTGRSLDEFRI